VPDLPDERSSPESARSVERELDFAELVLFLRSALPFAATNIVMLAELSRLAKEVRFAAEDVVWRAGDLAESFLVVVSGELGCVPPGGKSFRASHHHPAGLLEALTGDRRWYTATAAVPTRALAIPGRALVDAFEDNSDLAMAFIGSLAEMLLASEARRDAEPADSQPSVSASV
jgi:CRP-like cAMP-binding protein